ncbi:thiamine diphosphokinase [Desulfallas thermosapovorans]|uniref:Thiamine diphosphokinase n=1 Tax=Desulfallas thermosapovorans DSM 6562 TaxID=1121431 RepID=A0A5S4ZT12_9FIRM|nr:thiamine diphosphokinase [Desulfallas thermosapovorans]TYO96018.1 thiamine pyrophosphokinase [Desulfallas thermosapovorans DSM 6562]
MRCVILTGGTVEDLQWLKRVLAGADRLICVDSGTNYAAALGIVPGVIVGDMDSIDPSLLESYRRQGVAIKEYPAEKDDTDTALALAEALACRPDEVIILGATGNRFDHTLANVHLLRVALDHRVPARIINEYNEINLVAPRQPAVVKGRPGDEFSLLPLTGVVTGVQVRGARWPLENATFSIGNPYGISNRLAGNRADITIASGLMLLVRVK